jgi:hypothetical protein
MEWWQFGIVVLVVAGFFGLMAWLRSGSDGGMPPPGEPGDADRYPINDRDF